MLALVVLLMTAQEVPRTRAQAALAMLVPEDGNTMVLVVGHIADQVAHFTMDRADLLTVGLEGLHTTALVAPVMKVLVALAIRVLGVVVLVQEFASSLLEDCRVTKYLQRRSQVVYVVRVCAMRADKTS